MRLLVLLYLLLFVNSACNNDTQAPVAKKEFPVVEQPNPEIHTDSAAIVTRPMVDKPTEKSEDAPVKAPVEDKINESSPKNNKSGVPTSTLPVLKNPKPGSKTAIRADFIELTTLAPSIRLDIRYATANNFTKTKIYDCARCLLRPEAAQALAEAQEILQKKGYSLKMFDCYRPRPYQQRLWDKVPNPDYVTPPAKGSMHSRGAAVDLTIVDAKGMELDMGTPYDFFGEKAHTDYTKLSATILANRDLLRKTLESVGFKGIRTEWWHFSFQKKQFPLADYIWPCE